MRICSHVAAYFLCNSESFLIYWILKLVKVLPALFVLIKNPPQTCNVDNNLKLDSVLVSSLLSSIYMSSFQFVICYLYMFYRKSSLKVKNTENRAATWQSWVTRLWARFDKVQVKVGLLSDRGYMRTTSMGFSSNINYSDFMINCNFVPKTHSPEILQFLIQNLWLMEKKALHLNHQHVSHMTDCKRKIVSCMWFVTSSYHTEGLFCRKPERF